VLETRENVVIVQRRGPVGPHRPRGRADLSAKRRPFTVRFQFARNPNLAANGRYPLAVWSYDVSSLTMTVLALADDRSACFRFSERSRSTTVRCTRCGCQPRGADDLCVSGPDDGHRRRERLRPRLRTTPAVLLSHEAGSEYFSVRAAERRTPPAALNIRASRPKVYALAFVAARRPRRIAPWSFWTNHVAGGGTAPKTVHRDVCAALVERATPARSCAELRAARHVVAMTDRAERSIITAYRTLHRDDRERSCGSRRRTRWCFGSRLESALRLRGALRSTGAWRSGSDREFFPGCLCTEASGAIPARGSLVRSTSSSPAAARRPGESHGAGTVHCDRAATHETRTATF
jgi:hypothetical protein